MPKSPVAAKKKIKPGDVALIRWEDAVQRHGWDTREEYSELTPVEVASVGWVLTIADTYITLVQNVNPNHVGGSITIPTSWIQEIQKIL